MEKFTCVVDFNIILGADLQMVYQEMIDHVRRHASKEILEEIETVHEKMYVVYYNCYFHRFLKNYIPKWVITDLLAHRRYDTPHKGSSQSTLSDNSSKMRSFSSAKTKSTTPAKTKQSQNTMA
jgi:hypothetical protein